MRCLCDEGAIDATMRIMISVHSVWLILETLRGRRQEKEK